MRRVMDSSSCPFALSRSPAGGVLTHFRRCFFLQHITDTAEVCLPGDSKFSQTDNTDESPHSFIHKKSELYNDLEGPSDCGSPLPSPLPLTHSGLKFVLISLLPVGSGIVLTQGLCIYYFYLYVSTIHL